VTTEVVTGGLLLDELDVCRAGVKIGGFEELEEEREGGPIEVLAGVGVGVEDNVCKG
jgi:hypothetical protein